MTSRAVLFRVGVFVLMGGLGVLVFPRLMLPVAGLLVTSALSTFAAGALAKAAARAALRGVFLALLALFFLKGQNLSAVAGPAALIALALAGLFLLLIQMNLRRA